MQCKITIPVIKNNDIDLKIFMTGDFGQGENNKVWDSSGFLRNLSGGAIPFNEIGCTRPPFRYNFASSTTKKNKEMKTTTVTLAAILTLSINVLFAENNTSTFPVPASREMLNVNTLIPVTPAVADFNDAIAPEVNNNELIPFTPGEADFEDVNNEILLNMELSPVTPSTADFSDSMENALNNKGLAPSTPVVADFE